MAATGRRIGSFRVRAPDLLDRLASHEGCEDRVGGLAARTPSTLRSGHDPSSRC
jgi:hypothetical protein